MLVMSNLIYAWTNNKRVPDSGVKPFLDYVNKNRAYMINIGDYIFDYTSLKNKIILSKCLDCKRFQKKDCCCGNSYTMCKENADNLRSIARKVLESVPDNSYALNYFNSSGAITRNNATTTKGNKEGNCIFSNKSGGCDIHSWCLKNGKNPYKYKPYACSLFPIQGIITPSKKILIFNSTKETEPFSMFFYTLTRRVCVNEENMIKACSGEVGCSGYLKSIDTEYVKECDIINNMKPAYIEQEGIIRYLCGGSVYDTLIENIEQICK